MFYIDQVVNTNYIKISIYRLMAWACQSCTLLSREREYFIMKKTLLFIGIILSMLTVCAEDNVLQTIEIVPVKDTFNIVLVSDKAVDVKKTVQAANKITLDMKNIRASKTLNTVYNNVSNVDTVMVDNKGNGLSIFFQAENAQNASITFDSMAPILPAKKNSEEKQQVKLNSPIDSYTPIYREELAQGKTSDLFNKLTKKTSELSSDFQDSASDFSDTLNKTLSYGLIGLLAFGVIRLFKRKEPDMRIGLTQSLNEREIDMYKGANPLGSSYINTEKPFTTVNYGINAYRRENENPYESTPIHNQRLRNYTSTPISAPMQTVTATVQPKVQKISQAPSAPAAVKKHTTPVNKGAVNQSNPNVDNLKFLESMTAIYEKSGRHDLAQGLRTSLSKNNIK